MALSTVFLLILYLTFVSSFLSVFLSIYYSIKSHSSFPTVYERRLDSFLIHFASSNKTPLHIYLHFLTHLHHLPSPHLYSLHQLPLNPSPYHLFYATFYTFCVLVKTLSLRQLFAIVHHSAPPSGPSLPLFLSIIRWSICRHIFILKSLFHILHDAINCKLNAHQNILPFYTNQTLHPHDASTSPPTLYPTLSPLTSHPSSVSALSLPSCSSSYTILPSFPHLHPTMPSFCSSPP